MARLDELERKFEENPRRYFAPLANEYRKAGDAQRAAELCRSQLPDVPGHISGHIVLGQALYDARDFDGSCAALETALALDPENIVALRYLGDIARDTGDAAEAERWYSRTLEADPYNEAATTALQALRSAPAGAGEPSPSEAQQVTEETPQPTDGVAESPEPLSATDSPPAAGFEPTSYAAPEPSESDEAPPVAEVAPPIEIADIGPVEAVPDLAAADEIEPVEQATASATPTAPAEEATTAPPELASEAIAEPTELSAEITSTAMEPADQAPTESVEAVESAPLAAAEIESPPSEFVRVTGEFAGDLSVSTALEIAEPAGDETSAAPETTESVIEEPSAASEAGVPTSEEPVAAEPEAERFDVAAHAPSEPETPEEAVQAEERVLESAAPFVTETMADLYLEQGYPHEALELLLQLAEQRPQDEELRGKIEHIESVIVARRDAAVAAARAERAEAAEAAAGTERLEDAVEAAPEMEHLEAAVEAVEPEPEEPVSVQELFARMDRARPRAASAVTPRPISRRRSDFAPMPEGEAAATEASDDPFAFPNPSEPSPVPRTSGPQQKFNPSTADTDDFNAWLRGLRGP